jgi:hypothetical protein
MTVDAASKRANTAFGSRARLASGTGRAHFRPVTPQLMLAAMGTDECPNTAVKLCNDPTNFEVFILPMRGLLVGLLLAVLGGIIASAVADRRPGWVVIVLGSLVFPVCLAIAVHAGVGSGAL